MILSLQDIERARGFYATGAWRGETLYGALERLARQAPDRPLLRDPAVRLMRGEARQRVDVIAGELDALGLKRGDRVAIWLPSRVESALVLLACSRMGYVANTSLHRDYTTADIAGLLRQTGARALFCQPGYGTDGATRSIDEHLADLPALRSVFRLPPGPSDVGKSGRPTDAEASSSPDRPIYLAFTSGTTGQPKGVLHSDNTLLANGRALAADWSLGEGDVIYSLSPMSHNMGTVALATTLASGAELFVHPSADADTTLRRILLSKATYLLGVPTHAFDLLGALKRSGETRLGQVRTFQLAGSAIAPELAEQLLGLGVTPQNTYGMTENCSHQYTRPHDPRDVLVRTCGRSARDYEVAIWAEDDSDRPLAVGEIGEIGGRGASLMLGYFDDQSATERSFNRQGWFMTGDLGRLDEEGNLEIVGRKKDLIIRGGHNIHPTPIENLAMRHPAVSRAAVFPVPDERLGEKACIAVIVEPGGEIDGPDLCDHLFDLGLSHYDMPEYLAVLSAFPTTASGKVLKRSLVEMARSRDLLPQPIRWARPRARAS
jgi:acyl-CoA synthetase